MLLSVLSFLAFIFIEKEKKRKNMHKTPKTFKVFKKIAKNLIFIKILNVSVQIQNENFVKSIIGLWISIKFCTLNKTFCKKSN